MCTCHVLLLVGNCMDPNPPTDGKVNCSGVNNLYKRCMVKCDDGKAFLHPVPMFYSCGPIGLWNTNSPMDKFKFPPCGGRLGNFMNPAIHFVNRLWHTFEWDIPTKTCWIKFNMMHCCHITSTLQRLASIPQSMVISQPIVTTFVISIFVKFWIQTAVHSWFNNIINVKFLN